MNYALVALGGALGSVLRYGFSQLGIGGDLPLATLIINVFGAFVIGIVATYGAKAQPSEGLVLFFRVGLCGGFTTFSTFALETYDLIQRGEAHVAFIYVFGSLLLSFAAIVLAEKLVEGLPVA